MTQYWEENWEETQINADYAMNGYTLKDYQKPLDSGTEFVTETIGMTPLYPAKKKKNYGPDPRFKRVINTEYTCDGNSDAEKSFQKVSRPVYDSTGEEKVVSFFNSSNINPFVMPLNLKKGKEVCDQDLSNQVTKDRGFQSKNFVKFAEPEQDVPDLKTTEKTKRNSLMKLKRSASDCTLNKKKLYEDKNGNEITEKVRAYPSATKLSNVQNWIKSYSAIPEKRRSVITVIGQTQTKPLSKILSEINQRRKLAKELDKHALCEAIMGSAESQPEVKNIVAKVDLVLPNGKVIYSTEKVYLTRDSKFTDSGMYSHRSMEVLEAGDIKKKRFTMIPEKDSSGQINKNSKSKRSVKKIQSPAKEKMLMKDNVKKIWMITSSVMFWPIFCMIFLSLCFSFFFGRLKYSPNHGIADFFKPKTTAWYEKLLFS